MKHGDSDNNSEAKGESVQNEKSGFVMVNGCTTFYEGDTFNQAEEVQTVSAFINASPRNVSFYFGEFTNDFYLPLRTVHGTTLVL